MIYSFYHITDVHYYSKRNFKCDLSTFPQPNTQICILKSEEAFKKALEIIKADEDTNTVIITGDLTNHGEEYSHEEVKNILNNFTLSFHFIVFLNFHITAIQIRFQIQQEIS